MSAKQKSQSSVRDHNGSDLTIESTTTSSSNSSTSSSSESWFKSLKRNLSSKRRGGRHARSGGNLNRSEWDISHSRPEAEEAEPDFAGFRMSDKSVVSGLDLAHPQHTKEPERAMFYTMDAKRMAKLLNRPAFDKNLLHGIKQFNLEPSRGLDILVQGGFVRMEPDSLAEFLFNQERLSKKQIGSFLGGREDLNQSVLQRFVSLHHFSDLLVVQALRQFLWSFRLPGEAQQIDRIMSAFAKTYCSHNPGTFSTSDTVYILSFAIIMLNTGLHNKNVNKKFRITEDQFVAQNKGVDAGLDLPREMLTAIYNSIKEEPFKIPDESYDDLMFTFFSPDKEGWLVKQGGSWKNWKRRWFVLSDSCLYYFKHTAENVPKGIIPLDNVSVRLVTDDTDRPWQLEIYNQSVQANTNTVKGCKLDKSGTVVIGRHKVYRMSACSKEERDDWVECLMKVIRNEKVKELINGKLVKASLSED